MRPSRPHLMILALVALLALPGSAAAADLPDAFDDPVAAVQPAPVVPAPAPVAPAPAAPAADHIPEIDGIAHATVDPPRRAAATTASSASYTRSGGATLPFTGIGDGQLMLSLIVGSLLVCAGLVLRAHAAARAELV